MPSNPDVLAQKYYDGVIKVGVRGTLNPQLSVRQRKEDADAEAAVTRKLNEESVKAGASGASASAEADNQPGHLAEEPETQPAPTEVLVSRPKRKRQEPDMFTPMEQLRDFATGSRKRRRSQLECDHVCQNAACAAERAELDELRGRVLEMEAQHEELRQQLLEFAEGLMQSEESDATASRVPQIESLEAWAKLLKPGMVVAIRAAAHERHLEGKFWLLLVDSEAFPVLMELVHASDQYEEGWLVVRGRFFTLEQRSPRGYKLSKESRLIVVNTLIRGCRMLSLQVGLWGKLRVQRARESMFWRRTGSICSMRARNRCVRFGLK